MRRQASPIRRRVVWSSPSLPGRYRTSRPGFIARKAARKPISSSSSPRKKSLLIGWTATEGEDLIQRRFHSAGDDWLDKANASVPMGRLGQIDEIAEFMVFLLSSRSGVVTGPVIDWDQNVIGGSD